MGTNYMTFGNLLGTSYNHMNHTLGTPQVQKTNPPPYPSKRIIGKVGFLLTIIVLWSPFLA